MIRPAADGTGIRPGRVSPPVAVDEPIVPVPQFGARIDADDVRESIKDYVRQHLTMFQTAVSYDGPTRLRVDVTEADAFPLRAEYTHGDCVYINEQSYIGEWHYRLAVVRFPDPTAPRAIVEYEISDARQPVGRRPSMLRIDRGNFALDELAERVCESGPGSVVIVDADPLLTEPMDCSTLPLRMVHGERVAVASPEFTRQAMVNSPGRMVVAYRVDAAGGAL